MRPLLLLLLKQDKAGDYTVRRRPSSPLQASCWSLAGMANLASSGAAAADLGCTAVHHLIAEVIEDVIGVVHDSLEVHSRGQAG